MDTRLSDLEQLVSEIKKFRPDCKVAIDYLNKVIDKLKLVNIRNPSCDSYYLFRNSNHT